MNAHPTLEANDTASSGHEARPSARGLLMAEAAVNKWIICGTVMSGTIIAVLDSSIVNVALPTITGTLGASLDEITWVVTGYILATVIMMPIIAFLSGRFGRKRLYLASVALFTVSSMACGLARTLPVLVAFRVVQGLGGGVLTTVSQAILRESFPPEEQGIAMGLYGMGAVVAPAVGPTLGGWIVDRFSWPWIFYLNLPVGVVSFLLVTRFVHDPSYLRRESGRVDWGGLALLTSGLGALQLMLEKGQEKDWFESRLIVALALAAAGALALFVWRELTAERPVVDLRLLQDPTFSSATVLGGLLGAALQASLFILPVFLQRQLHYPAMDSGLALMPRSLAMMLLMPIGGLLYMRLGPRLLVGSGLVVSGYSFWRLAHLSPQIGFWDIFFPQLWQGVGFSLIFVALSTAALARMPRARMTAATGLYNVVRQVAGSMGIAVATTSLARDTVRFRAALGAHLTGTSEVTQAWLQRVGAGVAARSGVDPLTGGATALAMLSGEVSRQASVLAYNHTFLVIALLFAVALPLVLLLGRRRRGGAAEVEVAVD
jgi:MFS transporter, DHA2 family, multidrug resistance protein